MSTAGSMKPTIRSMPRSDAHARSSSVARTMRFAGLDDVEAGRAELESAIRAWCDWKAAASKAD